MDDVDKRAEVLRLHHLEHQGVRAISRKLQMSRHTVRKMLGTVVPKPREPGTSILLPYEDRLLAVLDDVPEIRAPGMLERLRKEGFEGGVTVVRDWLLRTRGRLAQREAFATLNFEPGEATQVDWADFGFAIPGAPRRLSCFVAVLCHSRLLYMEYTLSQSLPSLLRCMEHALNFFGGSTAVDIFDNMKTVVRSRRGPHVQFNPGFLDYAARTGFSVTACNVARGNEKGRVERPIGFIRDRFYKGRRFTSLQDANQQARTWMDQFANTRRHDVTGKVPVLVHQHTEKAVLKALPAASFNTDDMFNTTVGKTFRVVFDRNKYSVPHRLVGQPVVIRGDEQRVRICLGEKTIAEHARSWGVAEDIKNYEHEEGLLEKKPKARMGELPPDLAALNDVGVQYFKILYASSRSVGREQRRLVFLCETFGADATRDAMAEVMRGGHVGAEYVEHVLRHVRNLTPSIPIRLEDERLNNLPSVKVDLASLDELVRKKNDEEGET